MNNAVFGKTQENLRNRINLHVVTNREKALKQIAKPSYKRSQLLREDLVIIQSSICNLELNKPIYVGFSVLDLSKLLMYKFHYDKMLARHENIKLCFTDTDSLFYFVSYPYSSSEEVRARQDIYSDMLRHSEDYDTSDYPSDHPLFSIVNKKVIGKFKDELNSLTGEEFYGLLPKCYSILYLGEVKRNTLLHLDPTEKQAVKGTKEAVKKRYIQHSNFADVHANLSTLVVKQNIIKSREHQIGTYHQRKTALTAFDTKRWICDDNVTTLAYGHYKIDETTLATIDWDSDMDML